MRSRIKRDACHDPPGVKAFANDGIENSGKTSAATILVKQNKPTK